MDGEFGRSADDEGHRDVVRDTQGITRLAA